MATINLGAIKFNWKGAYNSGTTYAVDDVVSSGGNSYVCIQAHSTTQAVGNATAYWNIMSSAGSNGTNGSDGSDGTDLSTTLTTQGDLLYRDGSGLQRLAKGTANQELRINSGATAPEWHTPAVASSDYVRIGAAYMNNVTYYDHNSILSNTYRHHRILVSGLKTHGGSDELVFQYRKATGTILAADYQWNLHDLRSLYNNSHENNKYYENGGHSTEGSWIRLQNMSSRTTGGYESAYYDLTILNHGNGSGIGNGTMYYNNVMYSGGSGAFSQVRGAGFNSTMNNNEFDGFRLKTAGGNNFSGAIVIYGIK